MVLPILNRSTNTTPKRHNETLHKPQKLTLFDRFKYAYAGIEVDSSPRLKKQLTKTN